MSEEKTAEAKLAEAEAKLTEQQQKLDELQRKLDETPNNPDHFEKLKTERDEAKRKAKEYEDKLKELGDAEAVKKGEFEKLATERQAEIEKLASERDGFKETAEKWTSYEKAKREKLLAKITDEKKKKIAEQLSSLDTLEEFVELETEIIGAGSGNHGGKPPKPDKPIINYKSMK